MLYREIIFVYFQNHTKHINTLCGQNVEFVNVKLAVLGFARLKDLSHEDRKFSWHYLYE